MSEMAYLVLISVSLACLIWRRAAVWETTLVAPWCWAVLSLGTLAVVEMFAGSPGLMARYWVEPARFAAGVTTLCPSMAVLGAKRPQNRAWQFIVLTLFVLLCLPAAQSVLFRAGETLHLFSAWSWFLLLLLGIGVVNYLPTRFGPAAILVGLAQVGLLGAYIPFSLPWSAEVVRTPSVLLMTAGVLAATVTIWPSRRAERGVDRLWLDFRNAFGVVWAVRVAQRMRAASDMYRWSVTMSWNGVRALGHPPPEENDYEALAKSLRLVLRRFVSQAWIAERLDNP